MELKSMDIAPYKKTYTTVLLICILCVAASFFIVRLGYAILANIPETNTVKNVIMFSMIGVGAIFSFYQQKQKQKLPSITDFDEKLGYYQKILRSRLWWHALACIISAFLLFLTARHIFFYFAVLDLLLMFITFPSKAFIKKELNEENLIIH